jgi:hypothetical protein
MGRMTASRRTRILPASTASGCVGVAVGDCNSVGMWKGVQRTGVRSRSRYAREAGSKG